MARQALVVLMVVIVFGILVPIYKGFAFLDPRIIAAYACLALLFVAPASAELGMAPGNPLGRIAIIVAWGWGITLLILGTALHPECDEAARRVRYASVGVYGGSPHV